MTHTHVGRSLEVVMYHPIGVSLHSIRTRISESQCKLRRCSGFSFNHYFTPVSLMIVKLFRYVPGTLNDSYTCWPGFGSGNVPSYRGQSTSHKNSNIRILM